jgi:hypothetical protein
MKEKKKYESQNYDNRKDAIIENNKKYERLQFFIMPEELERFNSIVERLKTSKVGTFRRMLNVFTKSDKD